MMAPRLAPISAKDRGQRPARPLLAQGRYGCGGVGRADVFMPEPQRGAPGEQVALVVIAPPVGQDQVLHRVDAAADPRDEVIGLRGAAERLAAVEAAAILQSDDAVAQRTGGRTRSDPNRCRCRFSSSGAASLISATILVQCSSTRGRISGAEPQRLITRAGQ
jgi:hypothetical protein